MSLPSSLSSASPDLSTRTIAYFSMEIALSPALPTYSGGLGMLAGDTLRSAADTAAPGFRGDNLGQTTAGLHPRRAGTSRTFHGRGRGVPGLRLAQG